MTKINIPSDARSVVRPDGTEIHPFVLRDSDGYVITKAAIPVEIDEYDTGIDVVDPDETHLVENVDDTGPIPAESPANLPDQARFDNPQTAWQTMANVQVDNRHRPDQ